MNVEIQIWTLIGVAIAGGGIAISLILHAMGFLGERIDALDTKVDAVDTKVDALDAKVDALDAKIDTKVGALSNRMDIKFDLQSSRIDSLVAELGHVNLTLGELVGKAHTHDGVA
jgi:outer membrane murein-binding lipoprotein Lpp